MVSVAAEVVIKVHCELHGSIKEVSWDCTVGDEYIEVVIVYGLHHYPSLA